MEEYFISDEKIYVDRMKKSINNKLFFLDKIKNFDTIVDFGCADGAVISEIPNIRNYSVFGIDDSKDMLKLVKENTKLKHGHFFSSITYFQEYVKENSINLSNSVLLLSSVLHEVYSYLSQSEISVFWDFVFLTGFKYIVIRDMCIESNSNITNDDYSQIRQKILNSNYLFELNDFEEKWGKVDNFENLIHFCLKYKYRENWDREVRENYLSVPYTDIFDSISKTEYSVYYLQKYKLPHMEKQIQTDFSFNFNYDTHINLILKTGFDF